jgi:hypothetical protein
MWTTPLESALPAAGSTPRSWGCGRCEHRSLKSCCAATHHQQHPWNRLHLVASCPMFHPHHSYQQACVYHDPCWLCVLRCCTEETTLNQQLYSCASTNNQSGSVLAVWPKCAPPRACSSGIKHLFLSHTKTVQLLSTKWLRSSCYKRTLRHCLP